MRFSLHLLAFSAWMAVSTMAHAEKVFRYSEDSAVTNLDPALGGTVYATLIGTAIYDTLYEYKYLKRPYEIKPNLAEGMPEISKDGLTYTIRLKKGVRFIDDSAFKGGKGREVTAEDVVYSLKRHFDPKTTSAGAWLWQGRLVGLDQWGKQGADYSKTVEGLKALDSHRLQIKLLKPFPQLIYTLAMGFSAVVPHEAVKAYGKEFGVKPVGSGPFKVTSFTPKQVVLVRNPDFRKESFDPIAEGYDEKIHGATGIKALAGKTMPIVDKVVVDFMQEASARWASFSKGNEIQYATVTLEQADNLLSSRKPPQLKPEFAAKYHMQAEPDFGFVYTNFNMADPRVGYSPDPKQNAKNKALRCAIRKGFSWPERIKRMYLGIGEAFPGVIPPTIDGYSELSKDSITYDPEGAKKLLADAGWNAQNLPVLEDANVASVRSKQFFEQFRGWMTKIGYPREKIKYVSFANFGDFDKAQREKKLMLIPMGWSMDYPDSENLLQLYYGPNGSPGSNSANYNNPEYNKLYERASTMLPSPERNALYKQMNQMLIDDCVTISGFSRTTLMLWHKNAIAYPTRSVVGNIFKYVDVK